MNGHVYFEIQAEDPRRAIEFYRHVFGWKFEEQRGLPVQYWHIETGSTGGGLMKRPAQTPPSQYGTNAFVVSFEDENFDSTASKVVKSGGQVALPKFAVPGKCWQGYFLDTEGNTFGIFEVDLKAR